MAGSLAAPMFYLLSIPPFPVASPLPNERQMTVTILVKLWLTLHPHKQICIRMVFKSRRSLPRTMLN